MAFGVVQKLWEAIFAALGERLEKTPQVVADIVEQIDKIIKSTRFKGWQDSSSEIWVST